jgi:hypothetical protein
MLSKYTISKVFYRTKSSRFIFPKKAFGSYRGLLDDLWMAPYPSIAFFLCKNGREDRPTGYGRYDSQTANGELYCSEIIYLFLFLSRESYLARNKICCIFIF